MDFQWFKKLNTIKIGFEDVQQFIKFSASHSHSHSPFFAIDENSVTNANCLLINTLPPTDQNCLIKNTTEIATEEGIINNIIDNYNTKYKKIIIYGKNSADSSPDLKAQQLFNLGFTNIYIYCGGLFEWLLLQDIYGEQEFPTTQKVVDILHFK